ncbi:MAG: hypothetical protein IKH35_09785 [Prevotella sp.]|nr:hypothetical protein [Prevotella sp.]
MSEDDKQGIVFNIYGGSNQILPNATEAKQIFYGDQFAKEALRAKQPAVTPLTDDERRLAVYIEKEESLRNYVAQLAVCKTAADVGEVVALMCENEPNITEERIVKSKFIETLLPLIPGVEKGKGIDNIRAQINKVWPEHKRTLKHK